MSPTRMSWPPRSPWVHWATGAVLAAACLWPARDGALLTGIPLTALGIAACTAIAVALAAGPAPFRRPPLVAIGALAVLVVKIAAVAMMTPTGWAARYYANERFEGAHERSTEFRGAPWTRLEPRLQFEAGTFPLHFLNDLRFNFSPQRRGQPFSAIYDGYVSLDRAGTLRARVATMNGLEVNVDRAPLTTARPLEAGPHHIELRYAVQPLTAPKLDVTFDVDGIDLGTRVHPIPTTAAGESRSRWLRRALFVVDIIILGAIAAWVWLALRTARSSASARSPMTPIAIAAAGAIGVWLAAWYQASPSTFITISSGADSLAYVDYARRAILDGWLLNTGPSGNAALLYTIGYHATLSVVHVLFGESLVALFFFQDWLFWGTVGMTAAVAWRVAGWKAGTIAALIGIYFKWYLFWPATYAFRENLVVFLNAWLVFLVVKPAAAPADAALRSSQAATSKGRMPPKRAALIGAVAGYNYVTDPINLLVMPVLIWFVHRSADDGRRARSVQAFAAAAAIFFLLVPLRNLIVTGIPTVLPTEGAPTLWFGNRPPPGMLDNPGHAFYAVVWHYATSEPAHFASIIVQKIGYSFGLYWTMAWATPDSTQLSLILLLAWICAALGVSFAWRQSRGTIVLVALIATRWASIVVFIANHNVDRYEVALAMLLLPLAAVGLTLMWGWHRLLPALVVVALAIDHYTRISPEVGNYSAFTGARLLTSSSYSLQRRNLDWRLPLDARVGWTFPADTSLWMTPSVAVVEDDTPTFVAVRNEGLTLTSPVLAIPAPLVERLEIEAAFTGFVHVAHVSWQRKGMTAPSRAWLKVDQTGRMKTYRIPVSRSGDWTGVIERVSITYEGDAIEPARIALVTYPGVTQRPGASAQRPPR